MGKNNDMECPVDGNELVNTRIEEDIDFRNRKLHLVYDSLTCPGCGFKAGTRQQAKEFQLALSNAYRREEGLLTSEKIIAIRKGLRLTQVEFAEKIGVGIASIKRWETGAIQTKSMDNAIRTVEIRMMPDYSGEKCFSLAKVKIVILKFEELLGHRLLGEKSDHGYAGKYLWYTDFLHFKRTGTGITGATYAALPNGPQLNNYPDLEMVIKNAELSPHDQLTQDELDTIIFIAGKFRRINSVIGSALDEEIVKNAYPGQLLDYKSSSVLSLD